MGKAGVESGVSADMGNYRENGEKFRNGAMLTARRGVGNRRSPVGASLQPARGGRKLAEHGRGRHGAVRAARLN
ncbi:hypothetical protein AZSI13_16920 [Azospira sp. I13]|nr:hypothetical protein AZSI13_16920 [Azospira sp. I13]